MNIIVQRYLQRIDNLLVKVLGHLDETELLREPQKNESVMLETQRTFTSGHKFLYNPVEYW